MTDTDHAGDPVRPAATTGGRTAQEGRAEKSAGKRTLRRLRYPRAPINLARQAFLRLANFGLTQAYRAYRVHPAVWRFTAKHYTPRLAELARLNAWMICQHASLDVPAYQDHLLENGFKFRWWDLENYPITTKDSYVRRYGEAERCWNGRITLAGTVVDESAGSTGQPHNWLRSKRELNTVHKNMAGYTTMTFGTKNIFCINAFSMGAWATGTNTGLAMAKVAMVKNTGPDLEKILDTLEHFGPGYTYLITAYPPFLKHLVDRMDQDPKRWRRFRVHGFVGGEAMTEGLRDYLEKRLSFVYSGYGASDLTIGMAGETDLSVVIRKGLADPEFRRDLLGEQESRTPMIFQYNPLETYLETTADDELVVTINSSAVMSPRLRYNIGDEARLLSFPDMMDLLEPHPQVAAKARKAFRAQRMRLPFLLLYGRKDSTVSYMGANIYPLDVENGLYRNEDYARLIHTFRTELVEIGELEQRPHIHVQLRDPAQLPAGVLDDAARRDMAAALQAGVVEHLSEVSRDFRVSLEEDPSAADLRVIIHDHGTGPFATDSQKKIKNTYLI